MSDSTLADLDVQPVQSTPTDSEETEVDSAAPSDAIESDTNERDVTDEDALTDAASEVLTQDEEHATESREALEEAPSQELPLEQELPEAKNTALSTDSEISELAEMDSELNPAERGPVLEDADSNVGFNFDDLEQAEFDQDDTFEQDETIADVVADTPASSEERAEAQDDVEPPQEAQSDQLETSASAPATDSTEAETQSPLTAANSEEMESDQDDDARFNFDDLELPEYGEEDALADVAAEMPNSLQSTPSAFDTEERFSFDDLELPEYGEADALADVAADMALMPESSDVAVAEAPAMEEPAMDDTTVDDSVTPQSTATDTFEPELDERLDEQDMLSGLFGESSLSDSGDQAQLESAAIKPDYDEKAFDELLAEGDEHFTPVAKPIDQQASDSVGMDIDAMLEMGGEDWNGFSLSPEHQASIPDEIPEEEHSIWSGENQPTQAKVLNEDWGNQENLTDFNPQDNQYRTIDELMAEVDREEGLFNPDEESLKLDVGLSDFPDVLGQMLDVDVDANSEASGKLDLAKIYMEMNDSTGAIKLLEEAVVDGSDDIRREAKGLIDTIYGR